MQAHHFAQGPWNVGYERRVDLAALRTKRIAKAEAQRRAAGLDALLVWKDENCRYLTDLRPQLIAGKSTALNGALLVEGREPILFCSGGERDRVDRTMPWIKEAHTIPIIEEKALVEGLVERHSGARIEKARAGRRQARPGRSQYGIHQGARRAFSQTSGRGRRHAHAGGAQNQVA